MSEAPIYLDYHATTPVDPRVLEAMLPYFSEKFGNAGSIGHAFGEEARRAVDASRESIAAGLNCQPREIVFTSGATESNNLALKGFCERNAERGKHLVSATTEHKSVLDPLARMARRGYEVTLLPVAPQTGLLDPAVVAEAIRKDTLLVSVMLANNEIGVIQPIREIAAACHARGATLHVDATQAVGKIPIDLAALDADLVSFSGHKIYGPKGVGCLHVRRRPPQTRLTALLDGGGQEWGLRSGTLNVPGIVGMARAVELCLAELPSEMRRLAVLRNDLFGRLSAAIPNVTLNGPPLGEPDDAAPLVRLPGNLSASFAYVDGEALMMNTGRLAVSSGAACTSANPEPSHVLRAVGVSEDLTRASLRFGLGRFTTAAEIEQAVAVLSPVVARLRKLSSLA